MLLSKSLNCSKSETSSFAASAAASGGAAAVVDFNDNPGTYWPGAMPKLSCTT